MKILIRMPNWIGDAIMATPAVDSIKKAYPNAFLYLLSTKNVCEVFENDSRFNAIIQDRSKEHFLRIVGVFKEAKKIKIEYGTFDKAFVFTNSFFTTLFVALIGADNIYALRSNFFRDILLSKSIRFDTTKLHQAEIYNTIVNKATNKNFKCEKTSIGIKNKVTFKRKTVAIIPGASYGSAKRYKNYRFGEIALNLALKGFDILLLGAPNEKNIAKKIEDILEFNHVKNYKNLTGKTSLASLIEHIAGVTLFICNDSGPMHIAGALQVPTISIFGPTKHKQTYQWGNKNYVLIRHNISCSPCMKRECPLKHHKCMRDIKAKEILDKAYDLIAYSPPHPPQWSLEHKAKS